VVVAVTVTVSITLHNTLESIIPQVSAGSIGGINEGCPLHIVLG
jgi:hypothetical protein